MRIENHNQVFIAILAEGHIINTIDDILDAMADARYNNCDAILIPKENLDPSFFDLKSSFAGEMLQKFSNYRMRIAIIGDFTEYKSKSLQDFIYECNQGQQVFFKASFEEGIDTLSGSKWA